LTQEEFMSELEDEMTVFNSELLAAKVVGKAALQKAVNAVRDVLVNAVGKGMFHRN